MAQIVPTEPKFFLKPQKPSQSLHKSLKLFTVVANCFGLVPLDGVTSNSVEELSFRWISLKSLYSFLLLLQAFSGSVLHLNALFKDDVSCATLVTFCTYLIWLLVLAAYFDLATKWPKLIKKWYEVDLSMERVYNYPDSLNTRFKVTTTVAFATAVVFIVVTFCKGNLVVSNTFNNIAVIIGTQYIHVQLLNWLTQIHTIIAVFTWAFNDVFIILISTALALRLKQITDRVLVHGTNIKSLDFWSEIRTDYIRLFELCQLINEYIPFQISLSFASNIWFILLDLLLIVRYSNTERSDDITVSYIDLFWCAFTITCTALYTAWVNDESRRFAAALNCIPSKNYNLAIKLLLEQIPFNPLALSANNVFRCTRDLILNIFGAVITYELLLIQFGDAVILR